MRYKLNSDRDVDVLTSRVGGLSDGQLHSVSVNKTMDTVFIQVCVFITSVFFLEGSYLILLFFNSYTVLSSSNKLIDD